MEQLTNDDNNELVAESPKMIEEVKLGLFRISHKQIPNKRPYCDCWVGSWWLLIESVVLN